MTKSAVHDSLQRVLDVAECDMSAIAALLEVSMATVLRWSKQGVSQAAANKLGALFGIDPSWILMGGSDVSQSKRPSKHSSASTAKRATSQEPQTKMTPRETLLEFVKAESGALVLREIGTDEVLVTIDFADKVREIVGEEYIQSIGQHMISAAIASVMERQMRQYHAHIYDEMPKRFS